MSNDLPYGDLGTNTGWSCDRDPLATEVNPAGYFNFGCFFRNNATGTLFLEIGQPSYAENGDGTYTTTGLEWVRFAMDGSYPIFSNLAISGLSANLPVTTDANKNLVTLSYEDMKSNLGILVNSTRSYTSIPSPAFDSSRNPSADRDTKVIVNFTMTNTLGSSTTVNGEIDFGDGFQVIVSKGLNFGVLDVTGNLSQDETFELYVPANCTYKITQSVVGSGDNVLNSIYELSM